MRRTLAPLCVVLLGMLGAVPIVAQQTGVGTLGLATAGSGASAAYGVRALSVSPARLAWSNSVEWRLPSFGARLGLRPVSPRDVARFSGDVVPTGVREEWLERIEASGAQEGSTFGRVVPFGVARGPWAVQLSSAGEIGAALNADAAEALLFGNAGRTGTPRALDFSGSQAEAWASTTLTAGRGWTLPALSERLPGEWAVGVAGKLTFGHALWSAADAGSGTLVDPLSLEGLLPIVQTASGGWRRGLGVGADIGVSWRSGLWTGDLVLGDVVSQFDWDVDALEFRRGQLLIGPDTTFDGSDRLDYTLAPVALRTHVERFSFDRSITVALGRSVSEYTRVAIEGVCGPAALDPARSRTLGPGSRSDSSPCQGSSSIAYTRGPVVWRGGVGGGTLGVDVGAGVEWRGPRMSLEAAYGRRFGTSPSTALAVGAVLRARGPSGTEVR